MRFICKIILQYYLKIITKIVLWVHRPTVVVIAGSVNKTFVRDAVRDALQTDTCHVRSNPKNFNTEIGLPLAILHIASGYNSYRRWVPIMRDAARAIFQKNFPDCLVLELGVAQRGDMRYLFSLVSPHVTVITDITQRYVESFSGMDRLVDEYAYAVKNTQRTGRVLLNWNNTRVRALSDLAVAPVTFFGSITQDLDNCGTLDAVEKDANGLTVSMRYKKQKKRMHIPRFGMHHATAALVSWIITTDITCCRGTSVHR